MSELKLQSLENSSLYKRRTTSRENLLQVAGGEPFRRPTTPTMAERLYQNGPSIRNSNATTPLYSNIADKHFSPQQPSSSALLAADAIVRDLSSVNLGSGSSTGYQNVPLPLASSTPVRRKMELREQSGRSNVEVIGLVWGAKGLWLGWAGVFFPAKCAQWKFAQSQQKWSESTFFTHTYRETE